MQLRHLVIAYLHLRHKAQSLGEPPQYPRPHMRHELREQQQPFARKTAVHRNKPPTGNQDRPSHSQLQ